MVKIFLFFLFSLCISYSYAQTGNPDSIKQKLQNDNEDTSRVLNLANLSFEYLESKPDTSMALALEALDLANRIGFEKGKAVSLNRVGNVYNVLGNYPKGLEVFLQALQINEKINNGDRKQRNLGNIGLIYFTQEDYRQALDYYFKAKSLAQQINNKGFLSLTCINIAADYDSLKVYDSAKLYAQQAYDIASTIHYNRVVGFSLHELGHIYFMTGQNNSSLEFYRLSISFLTAAKNDLGLSQSFLDIVKVFQKINQDDSILFYAKKSFLLANEKRFNKELREAAGFLSYYYRKFNADSAFFYQDVSRAANDFLFSQQKQRQMQSLSFDEKLRQQEIMAAKLKANEERKQNIQYAAIAVGLITFIILVLLLSRSIIVKQKFIEFFAILGLLAMFEFINLFIHPWLAELTNNSPLFMLLILIGIGALLVPLHHRLEKWIIIIMVEKNKKIRLDAMRKTITNRERESPT